ncbi:MAG: LytTR family transcriptional regulator [Lachnospiraceae bacterium]|nr:LytTR family transcriptional regulator [Lachnospiraceae bacterium]
MKVIIELDDHLDPDEIFIRCKEVNEEVLALQRSLAGGDLRRTQIEVYKGEEQCFLPIQDILFAETGDHQVMVHTRSAMYASPYKLYELEELLPPSFLRISKSAIANTSQVFSVRKNVTGASPLAFKNSTKTCYVSRSYLKPFLEKMQEKRLSK